ncbi:uncharacterized protein LOC129754838 [Uranotaenia lowii]|uniref:uncharacterized protein LOC129754838 n=1 Tax=Uranotaenia lowii TaxID=190385 RepID=UPI00247A84EE|nr:uncharacterized protein LOC129754838 [Uranotaenia lowii]
MIIFLYLILVLAWALLIIILKCKKARAKRLAELEEAAQQVHVVQIGSNLYDIMSIHHHHHRHPYGTMYDCLGTGAGDHHHHLHSSSGRNAGISHSNAAFVGDDGSVYPGSNIPPLEPPPSYDEVIRLPAHYPKVETFVPEMVVPPPSFTPTGMPPTITGGSLSLPNAVSDVNGNQQQQEARPIGTVEEPRPVIGAASSGRVKPTHKTTTTTTTTATNSTGSTTNT